jgi:hypothetical protein
MIIPRNLSDRSRRSERSLKRSGSEISPLRGAAGHGRGRIFEPHRRCWPDPRSTRQPVSPTHPNGGAKMKRTQATTTGFLHNGLGLSAATSLPPYPADLPAGSARHGR